MQISTNNSFELLKFSAQGIALESAQALDSFVSSLDKKLIIRYASDFLIAVAIVLVITGTYTAIKDQSGNIAATKQATAVTHKKTGANTEATPSTDKPDPNSTANYSVAPNLPRLLSIPSIGVNARVVGVGLTSKGAISTPSNVYDAAWYNGSGFPGQNGAMLIDGHVSSWTTHGVFYSLGKLKAGDEISLEKGDRSILKYQVVRTETYDVDNVDMAAALSSAVQGRPGLNLMTCSGDVIKGTNEFNKRTVVYSVQI